MDIQRNETIIGKGVLFPIILSPNPNNPNVQGWYPVTGDPDLIKHNLITLIEYHIGQRFRQEYYGTRLWECLEEPSVPMLLYLVNSFLQEAIGEFENRVTFKHVRGYLKGSKIFLELRYNLSLGDIANEDSLTIEFDNFNK